MFARLNKNLKIFILSFVASLLLSSCTNSDTCYTTDPKKYINDQLQKITSVSEVEYILNGSGIDPSNSLTAPGGWVSTGITINTNDQLKIRASGTIVLAFPYGLTPGGSAAGYINSLNNTTINSPAAPNGQTNTSSFYDNNGLGTMMTLAANSTSAYTVTTVGDPNNTPYFFASGVNVYITTPSCSTGAASYCTPTGLQGDTCQPAKWTWPSWEQVSIQCNSHGSDRSFTVSGSAGCKAIECCKNFLGICTRSESWACVPQVTNNPLALIDTCPSTPQDYNCQTNQSKSSPCYPPSASTYNPVNGDFCNDTKGDHGITASNTSPGCGFGSGLVTQNPLPNACGSVDSCWNTGGYNLYATQKIVSCPGDPSCTHLQQSSSPNGQSFVSTGGNLYLKIFDPNATSAAYTGPSVADLNSQLDNYNAQAAADLTLTNNLTDQIYAITNQTTLSNGNLATSNGFLASISSYGSILAPLQTTIAANPNLASLNDNLVALQASLSILQTKLAPSDDPTVPWTLLTNINSQANNALTSINGATDATSTSLTTALNAITSLVSQAQKANTTLLNTRIDLNNQYTNIANVNQQLIIAQRTGPSTAVGGYTAYVKSDPLTASNGKYARIAIAPSNPNIYGAALTDLGLIDQIAGQSLTASSAGSLWVRIENPTGNYSNSGGNYTIAVQNITTSQGSDLIIVNAINLVQNNLSSAVQTMYENLTCTGIFRDKSKCSNYISIISYILTLYIIIYGIMYSFGLIRTDHVDFVLRLVKLGFVIALITPNSFYFFKTYLFDTFLDAGFSLLSAMSGQSSTNPFNFIGESIAVLLLDPNTYTKILALMFQGLLGFVAFVLILYGILVFVMALFEALTVFLMCLIGLTLCFAMAPIFIPFVLFHQTEGLFDHWIKFIFRFTLEPVILFAGLVVLNGVLMNILQQLFNFSACFKCTFPIFARNIPGLEIFGNELLLCIPWFSPWGVDNIGSGIAFSLYFSIPLVISFCMVTKLMEIYANSFAKTMTQALIGIGPNMSANPFKGGGSSNLGINPLDGLSKGLATGLGMDQRSQDRRSTARQNLADNVAQRAAAQSGGAGGSEASVTSSTARTTTTTSTVGGVAVSATTANPRTPLS